MSTPIKAENSLYNIYSPEDIQEKSRFIPTNTADSSTNKKSIVSSLETLSQKLRSCSSDKSAIQKVLLELEENKLAEVNALNDASTTNLFYRIKTQAVALDALAVYEASGKKEFPEDDTFETLEQLQTLRTPVQVVWDCVFGSDAVKVLKLKKARARALAKSILSSEPSESTMNRPLIAIAVEEPFSYEDQYSTCSTISAKDVKVLEAFENSKSCVQKATDFLLCRNDVKKAIAVAKTWSKAGSFDDSFTILSPMMTKNDSVVIYAHRSL